MTSEHNSENSRPVFIRHSPYRMIAASVPAAKAIEGTVVIKKKLTKRRVTAQVPMYERGPAVGLGADAEADPLAFERSRVAVYLEGTFSAAAVFSRRIIGEARGDCRRAQLKPVPKMEQSNRRFAPEMLVIEAGSKVSFPNNDPIFHNVFSRCPGSKTFDLGNYPKGDTRMVMFPEPGIVYVNCHLHPNMTATIVVAPNKWNTQADRDGQLRSCGMFRPGKYISIVAWHKAAGFARLNGRGCRGRGRTRRISDSY